MYTFTLGCYDLDFVIHCLHVVGLHDLDDQKALCRIPSTVSNPHNVKLLDLDKMYLHMNSITAIAMLLVHYRINAIRQDHGLSIN